MLGESERTFLRALLSSHPQIAQLATASNEHLIVGSVSVIPKLDNGK